PRPATEKAAPWSIGAWPQAVPAATVGRRPRQRHTHGRVRCLPWSPAGRPRAARARDRPGIRGRSWRFPGAVREAPRCVGGVRSRGRAGRRKEPCPLRRRAAIAPPVPTARWTGRDPPTAPWLLAVPQRRQVAEEAKRAWISLE